MTWSDLWEQGRQLSSSKSADVYLKVTQCILTQCYSLVYLQFEGCTLNCYVFHLQ